MRGRKLIYPDGLTKVHVMLPPAFIEVLTDAANRRGVSRSKLVRKILSVFLTAELKRHPGVVHEEEEFFQEDEIDD